MADNIQHDRCGYCYEEFSSMRDPRELPCHHSFCLECLKGDYAKHGVVSCPLCNKKYESEEALDKLPRMRLSVQGKGMATTSTSEPTCECDDCDNQVAVCYCLQCCRRICAVHVEYHTFMFKRSHSVVEISEYKETAERHTKFMCPTHEIELSSGCENCDRLACSSCEISPAVCASENDTHDFMPLSELREKITAEFDKLLQLANAKLTKICVIDKQIWRTLDKEKAKCKEKTEFIEKACEEQIQRIKEESEMLKERIQDYQKRLTSQIGVYSSELITRKEKLENSCTHIRKHLRDSHVTELVKLRRELTFDLERQLATLKYQLITEPILVHAKVHQRAFEVKLTDLPKTLTLTSKCLTTSICYSVYHKKRGGLLVGQSSGITLVRGTSAEKLLSSYTTCAVEHKGVTYLLESLQSSKLKISQSLSDLSKREELFTSYMPEYDHLCLLAVSDEFIVCCTQKKKLTIYNTQSKQRTHAEVEKTPKALYFSPSGDLLVTSRLGDSNQGGVLTRYQVENGKLTTVWRCEGLQNAYGVCESDGLIYVSTSTSKSIHILSLQGKILHKIEEEQLPARAGQISVRGDELAVPGWNDKHVYIFNINH